VPEPFSVVMTSLAAIINTWNNLASFSDLHLKQDYLHVCSVKILPAHGMAEPVISFADAGCLP
jgi:hypothetical protein